MYGVRSLLWYLLAVVVDKESGVFAPEHNHTILPAIIQYRELFHLLVARLYRVVVYCCCAHS